MVVAVVAVVLLGCAVAGWLMISGDDEGGGRHVAPPARPQALYDGDGVLRPADLPMTVVAGAPPG